MGGPIGAGVQLNTEGGFGTHICDVEVDVELGIARVIRYTAIHPGYVEGQMQGAVGQGIGWALNEEPRGEVCGAVSLARRKRVKTTT